MSQPPGQPPRAISLATVIDGVEQPAFDLPMEGSPSMQLLAQRQYLVADHVLQHYPRSYLGGKMGARAYAGQQLCSADGEVIGAIFVLFRQALTDPDFVTSTLQIFAARASAEIERLAADARIRHQASLLDKAQDAILVRDLDHRIIYWNKSAEHLYGWSQLQVLGQPVHTLLYEDNAQFYRATEATLEHGEWTGELVQRHRDGRTIDVEGRWTLVRGEDGQPQSILAINTDITQRKATEREIQRLAFYDPLTNLPNRMLLMDRMHHALAAAQRHQHQVVKTHGFHGAGGGAHITCVAGLDKDETGAHGTSQEEPAGQRSRRHCRCRPGHCERVPRAASRSVRPSPA